MAKATLRTDQGRLRFDNGELELTFDAVTARWLTMRELAGGTEILHGGEEQAPVLFTVGGRGTASRARGHMEAVVDTRAIGADAMLRERHVEEKGGRHTLVLSCREGEWDFDQRYTLIDGAYRAERTIRLAWSGAGTVLLRGMELRFPPACLGREADCFVEAPGYATRTHHRLVSVPFAEYWNRLSGEPGDRAPGWRAGIVALENPVLGATLTFWAFNRVESLQIRLMRVDAGARISNVVNVAARMRSNEPVEWEVQAVQLTRGGWREALGARQAWYDEIGVRVPADVPEWIRNARIYNTYVGILPYFRGGYPTHDLLIADLPRIRNLGFDVIYTMPHVPFPHYDAEDYLSADNQYGSADGLRQLVRTCHDMGMRVMLDLGIHGVMDREMVEVQRKLWDEHRLDGHPLPDKHPYRIEHPEWFMQTERGEPAAISTWSFDHANAGWQAFLARVLSYYAEEFGVDAYRIDAPTWIPFPNWAEGLPYRASASIYGQAEAFEKARRIVHAKSPQVVFYSEAPGPLYCAGFDCLYNYDYQWLFSSLLAPSSPKGYPYRRAFPDERITARDLGPWLEQHQLSKPRGSLTVHHLDSADVHGWSNSQYRREVFGERQAQVFFALCVAIAGPLMMFQGAETGMEDFYRRILSLKATLPALDYGDCDFLSVECDDPHIFAPLRRLGRQIVVPLLRIAPSDASVRVTIPASVLPDGKVFFIFDRMDGSIIPGPSALTWPRTDMAQVRIEMRAFQIRFLEIATA